MQIPIIDLTSLEAEDSENLEDKTQELFDELARDPHAWAIVVSRFITRNEPEDRLALLEMLKSHRRLIKRYRTGILV